MVDYGRVAQAPLSLVRSSIFREWKSTIEMFVSVSNSIVMYTFATFKRYDSIQLKREQQNHVPQPFYTGGPFIDE